MSSSSRLVLSPGGRLLLVKEAAAGHGADRLRREAEILRRAACAGVVELVDVDELDGGGVALAMAFVAGGTLADAGDQVDPPTLVGIVAGLAATLADLHDRGIVHGRLSADHVLLGGTSGGPVLCGLAEARVDGEPAGTSSDDADDGEALAALVDAVTVPGSEPLTDALRQAVGRCRAGAGEARPTLRGLAATLAGMAADDPARPGAQPASARSLLPRRAPAPRRRPDRRTVALAGSAVVAVAGLVTLALAIGGRPAPSRPAAGPSATTAVPSISTSTSAPAPTTTVPPPPTTEAAVRIFPRPQCPTVEAPAADVDGDGCLDDLELAEGVIAAAGGRWQVAAPDDLVVIGDWDCDGLATPAVIRPSSGHVWTYPGWAGGGDGIAAEPVDVVPAPVAAANVVPTAGADAGAGQCDGIEVIGGAGERHLVETGA